MSVVVGVIVLVEVVLEQQFELFLFPMLPHKKQITHRSTEKTYNEKKQPKGREGEIFKEESRVTVCILWHYPHTKIL